MPGGGESRRDDEHDSRATDTQSENASSASTITPQSASTQISTDRTPVQQSAHASQTAASRTQPQGQPSEQMSDSDHHSSEHNGFPLSSDPRILQSSPSSPRLQPTYRSTRSLGGSEATSPSRIKVRDLSHIQSFASEEYLARPQLGQRGSSFEAGRQYEISSMPVTDIIEMVAGLLTRITTTNDRQHEHLQRPIQAPQEQGNLSNASHCVLAFHGKNVPSITILSYLSRIHKYCPTTYEVFLSLLVYFDRMTENFTKRFAQQQAAQENAGATTTTPTRENSTTEDDRTPMIVDPPDQDGQPDLSQIFAVDSFNIHRLVIAGVTCASKFFSDVFYTNSRYAKVGGLPLVELNNLELQFLLLNDFRLSIPVEELEAYGTMLVEFYAREIVAQQQAAHTQHEQMQGTTHTGDEMYMRDSRSTQHQTTQS